MELLLNDYVEDGPCSFHRDSYCDFIDCGNQPSNGETAHICIPAANLVRKGFGRALCLAGGLQ